MRYAKDLQSFFVAMYLCTDCPMNFHTELIVSDYFDFYYSTSCPPPRSFEEQVVIVFEKKCFPPKTLDKVLIFF
uniref:Uncharacterized protein n=1 Tax=Schistosoma curassoni TaxID=6186 RepID=A0A183L380_9TREM